MSSRRDNVVNVKGTDHCYMDVVKWIPMGQNNDLCSNLLTNRGNRRIKASCIEVGKAEEIYSNILHLNV